MKTVAITRDILALYDKYDGDFGLISERWALKEDQNKATPEQMAIFGEYVDKLHFIQCDPALFHPPLMENALKKVAELETFIDGEVVAILRERVRVETEKRRAKAANRDAKFSDRLRSWTKIFRRE